MKKIILSCFADEYSPIFEEQIEVVKSNNLSYVELRNIFNRPLFDYSFDELKEFKKRLDEENIKVSSIASPIGKSDISSDFSIKLNKAEKIFQIANLFNSKYVRIFSFYNKNNIPIKEYERKVFDNLTKLVGLAKKYNVILCHENEALIYGENYQNIYKLVSYFKGDLKIVFDMGNFILDGVDPLLAYHHLKDYIEYFHLKDSLSLGAVVPLGKGEAKVKEILSMYLTEFKKDVLATIEPHLQTFDGLNSLIGKKFENPYKFKDMKTAFLAGVESSKKEVNKAMNIKTKIVDKLLVKSFDNREEMGNDAANDIKKCFLSLLTKKEEINVIFAAAPSQNDVLLSLVNDKEIPWNKINAFHMDEYIGLDKSAPQGFGNFLKSHIFGLVPFKSVNYIDISAKDSDLEADRYSKLLKQYPCDVVVMGIGENGHIAFNDPPVADFNDSKMVKAVKLDEICRNQQVHDGCFASIDLVPTHAMTLTVPALFNGKYLFCIVPCLSKAKAVKETLNGNIDEHCPASILRKHDNAILYLDKDSSSLIDL